jgi:hypothetical protein
MFLKTNTHARVGRSKGYGFVTFRTAAAASAALEEPTREIDVRRRACPKQVTNEACIGSLRTHSLRCEPEQRAGYGYGWRLWRKHDG